MEFFGMFLFYVGALAFVLAVLKLLFNYSAQVGTKLSKKVSSKKDTQIEDKNLEMINSWLKSNIISIIWRFSLMIIGLIILLIYDPGLLPWG